MFQIFFFATLLCLGVKDKQLKRINRRRRPNIGKLAKLLQNSPHTVRQGLFFPPPEEKEERKMR